MDAQLRTLEREVKNGREDLVPLYGNARAKAGLFWAETVKDRYLGDALALHNLPVDGTRVNIIYGLHALRNSRRAPVRKTIDDWLEYSTLGPKKNPGRVSMTSPELKTAVALALYETRNDPALQPALNSYTCAERRNQFEDHCLAKCNFNLDHPETMPFVLEDISMQRTKRARTIATGFFRGHSRRITLAPRQTLEQLGTPLCAPPSSPFVTALLGKQYARAIPALQHFTARVEEELQRRFNCTTPVHELMIKRIWGRDDEQPCGIIYYPGSIIPNDDSGFFIEPHVNELVYASCWRQMNRPSLDVRVSSAKPADRCLVGHDSLYPVQKKDSLFYCPEHPSSVVHQKCAHDNGIENCVLLGCDQPYQTRKPLDIRVKKRGAQ